MTFCGLEKKYSVFSMLCHVLNYVLSQSIAVLFSANQQPCCSQSINSRAVLSQSTAVLFSQSMFL